MTELELAVGFFLDSLLGRLLEGVAHSLWPSRNPGFGSLAFGMALLLWRELRNFLFPFYQMNCCHVPSEADSCRPQ